MSKLYLVPTPIGNLEDFTFRAVRILKETEIILAEDTRRTQILLKKYDIHKTLTSYHKYNEHKITDRIVEQIQSGKMVALVADAGTPGISDPGYFIVNKCLEKDIPVECLPGPTALIPALASSGIPSNRFAFEGFLPAKKGRKKRLQELACEKRTIILYESPHRIIKTLKDLSLSLGPERNAVLARELTKIHEEIIRGTIEDIVNKVESNPVKGEIVIIIQGNTSK